MQILLHKWRSKEVKVLLVDQFGKTAGRDTLALAELINQNQEIDMTVYLSDTTEIPSDQHTSLKKASFL